ncbi:hypothetical protein BEI59_26930 [Eisenbergiella tayi]|uniref:Uncharacterized protein n=1 Tax=Eisenbergiella tayi TaxID=1432052 RepID=A0A1E3UAC3_9FIRM|nr:hypothetical protein [Eisenbergiella tayi]ODR45378.1 hypothetical protein BEI59_26930 [Eisenbergiella tayi]RJW34286.1 hypothetical protein DXC97_24755 [Lachnospiraceae bacterium TF09-5]
MKKKDIKLTEDTIQNIQIMAPMLNDRQQAIVFGMILGMVPDQTDLQPQLEAENRKLQEV